MLTVQVGGINLAGCLCASVAVAMVLLHEVSMHTLLGVLLLYKLWLVNIFGRYLRTASWAHFNTLLLAFP